MKKWSGMVGAGDQRCPTFAWPHLSRSHVIAHARVFPVVGHILMCILLSRILKFQDMHHELEIRSLGANILPIDWRARLTCFWIAHKVQNPTIWHEFWCFQFCKHVAKDSVLHMISLISLPPTRSRQTYTVPRSLRIRDGVRSLLSKTSSVVVSEA